MAERGIEVDHVTLYRWVQRFTPQLVDAARPSRHSGGDRWLVDETYLKVAGVWKYLYRAVDQFGQVIDVMLSSRRDANAALRFFQAARLRAARPVEVTTDRAAIYPPVLDDLLPGAFHNMEKHANNRVEADHGRLKARLRPMRGLKVVGNAAVIAIGHAFIQNLRRGHYELGVEAAPKQRLIDAFDELALAI